MVRVVVAGINPVETYIREGKVYFESTSHSPMCIFNNNKIFRSVQQVARAAIHTWHRCCWFCASDWKESVQHQGRQLSKHEKHHSFKPTKNNLVTFFLQVGDRVFVSGNSSFSNNSGSYAQFVVTDSTYVFPLHPRLTFAQVLCTHIITQMVFHCRYLLVHKELV